MSDKPQEPMTEKDYKVLTASLNDMKLVQRPKILVAIEEARQLGDLKENAEYHAAKDDKDRIDTQIAELEDLITRIVILDPATLPHERVSFGSTVKLVDVATEEEITYTLVSSINSNPDIGNISFNSPLAKQLLGKKEADEFTAVLPGGKRDFEVEAVYFDESKIC